MLPYKSKLVLFLAITLLFLCCGRADAQALTFTTMSPTSGAGRHTGDNRGNAFWDGAGK